MADLTDDGFPGRPAFPRVKTKPPADGGVAHAGGLKNLMFGDGGVPEHLVPTSRESALEADLIEVNADRDRLRDLLAEALDAWAPDARSACTNGDRPSCTYVDCGCVQDIDRIRREAGL
jgi:hypothetical protein